MYELFIEGQKADINEQISVQLTFAIDDVANFSSRETGFSKQIVLPGTAANHTIFGHIHEMGSSNPLSPGQPNIGAAFNVAQTSRAELRLNGLLVLRGVFRLTGIVKTGDMVEYEGAIFGELAGFIAQIGNKKLEDLDFSAYNHTYTRNNIVNSWDTVNGSGYYYPLIDHGTYSTPQTNPGRAKIDYDYRTFRPALYVKEYMDKIFSAQNSGYTYESTFFDSAFFKRLIIPNNFAKLTKVTNDLLHAIRNANLNLTFSTGQIGPTPTFGFVTFIPSFNSIVFANNFTGTGNPNFTYTSSEIASVNIEFALNMFIRPAETSVDLFYSHSMRIRLLKNDEVLYQSQRQFTYFNEQISQYNVAINETLNTTLNQNDTLKVELYYKGVSATSYISYSLLKVTALNPVTADLQLNDQIYLDEYIPKNILQKDFFTWILKMFNLYVTEDKLDEKKLLIEPYVDYYGSDTIDWTYKVARDKPWQIKPMGMLNGRFFEYKFKEDNDFYSESYRKKFNQSYGDRLEDTQFQFAKDRQTIEIGFSPTVLVQYDGTDQQTKVLPAIYKKSTGNAVDQEELIESNIRILQAKKITGVASWYIRNNTAAPGSQNLGAALTVYGYAGHFDDPVNPTKDINFGAAREIYFDPNVYPSANLFNDYWSEYIAEIADKDSKILTCFVYLTPLDIAQLDFSKAVFIDGIRFRINKVLDYDYTNNELVKVELLKIINNE